jgi:hypothetical protein
MIKKYCDRCGKEVKKHYYEVRGVPNNVSMFKMYMAFHKIMCYDCIKEAEI